MSPDPSVLGSDIILGPLAFLAFIAAALGYAAREYRKGRDARVEDHQQAAAAMEAERDQARDERDAANRTIDRRNATIVELKEQHMLEKDTEHARLVKARAMLVERGVKPEDLP